jgi:hypothetical protein
MHHALQLSTQYHRPIPMKIRWGPIMNPSQIYLPYLEGIWSRDSVVGIATGYVPDYRVVGVRVQAGSRIFFFPCRPDRLCGPSSILSNGCRGLFPPVVERLGREADHSFPASAEVKKMWIYISTPPTCLHGVMLNWLSTGTTFFTLRESKCK